MARKKRDKWQYGDFQTPLPLARAAMDVLQRMNVEPMSIIEPTCGKGAFLLAAMETFPHAVRIIGADINKQYLEELQQRIASFDNQASVQLLHQDFFRFNWQALLRDVPQPILIVGNPPWVTSSELGLLESINLPCKSNFHGHSGLDALMGKSNFDLSEWMLIQHLDWLHNRRGVIALLCKTAVARKVLSYAWKHQLAITGAKMFLIDAHKYFDASVDACFLVIDMSGARNSPKCDVYDDFAADRPAKSIGYHDNIILSDIDKFKKWRHLRGHDKTYVWRSGIKHDCAKVMELTPSDRKYLNGLGELVDLEDNYVYPLLKSSDIGNGEIRYGRKYMLVTQKFIGDDTSLIKENAPTTASYLEAHSEMLSKRGSSIYRHQPPFSIFGVGDYSFSRWKIAISGFYKKLSFKLIEPYKKKPVVLDDTTYFLPCRSEAEARFITHLLDSKPAQQFFESMVFWTDKRPITIEILKQLDIHALSLELGCEKEYVDFARNRNNNVHEEQLTFGFATG